MDFQNLSNDQIIKLIAQNIEKKRLSKNITAENMAKKGGHGAQVYSNFINKNTNIKLETLIQMLRGIGELDKLQEVFDFKEKTSLYNKSSKLPKRASATRIENTLSGTSNNKPIRPKWGDEL